MKSPVTTIKSFVPPLTLFNGFTVIELLIVIAIVSILVCVRLPLLAQSATKSKTAACIGNLKQLVQSCLMHVADNNDRFPNIYHGGGTAGLAVSDGPPWAVGWLDWTSNPDNTNILYLINPRFSTLAQYFNFDRRIYKCPSDYWLSQAQINRKWPQRVLSFSGNIFIGKGNAEGGPMDTSLYNHIEKLSQLIKPKPAESWIYLDEHPDSIQDPGFFAPNSATHWVDLPASYHDGAGVLAFVGGHVELKKWASVYTIQPVNKSTYGGTSTKVGDIDISWFRVRIPMISDTQSEIVGH